MLLAILLAPLVVVGIADVVAPPPARAQQASSAPLTLQEFANDNLNGRPWNAYDQSVNADGPTIFGRPSLFTDPKDGDLHVYVWGANGDLYELVNGQGNPWWKITDLTAADGGNSPLDGSPCAFYDPADGLVHVYVVSNIGHLVEYVNDGVDGHSWNAWDLTAGASDPVTVSGTPSVFYDPADGLIHAYVQGPDGYLFEYVDGGLLGHLWNAWGLSAGATGGGPVAGSPSAFLDPADGLIHVYAQGPGGQLTEYDNGNVGGVPWNAWGLSIGATGGGPVTSDPTAFFNPLDGLIHVYAVGTGGDLTEYDDGHWGGRPWNAWDLSVGASGGGPVASQPSLVASGPDHLIHLYVRAANGDLVEYDNGNVGGHPWNAWDLTYGSQGPVIGGDPTGAWWGGMYHVFVGGPTPPPLVQHVVALATSQDQYYGSVSDSPPGSECNPYTAAFGRGSTAGCTPGTAAEQWCSDFADWVWSGSGIPTGGITGYAFTFVQWAEQHAGAWQPGATNDPEPGDAVVWGDMAAGYAEHVAVVIGVSQGQIDVVSGNADNGPATAVMESGYFDPASSTDFGYPIIGYVAPTQWTAFTPS
ncbi:MAG TPA: CHAP domain-containing protein [Acidimicrobiales bacterium]|nr:CHAP domain-containing protein [Acidimicrobiales bacterium]